MKWRTACVGDIRWVTRFAVLPTKCEDGNTRWLCNIEVKEKWGFCGDLDGFGCNGGWHLEEAHGLDKNESSSSSS